MKLIKEVEKNKAHAKNTQCKNCGRKYATGKGVATNIFNGKTEAHKTCEYCGFRDRTE